jgi:glycerate dehydrogenase
MKAVILEANIVNEGGEFSWAPFEKNCEFVVYEGTTEENKWERMEGAEAVLANKLIMDEEVFERFPQIKYVGVCATGYNNVDLEAAKRHGVTVSYVPAYSTESVTQHTWALILSACCDLTRHDNSVKSGDWIRKSSFCYQLNPILQLSGRTLGVYGFGNIGRAVAKVALSFGMKVLVFTRHPSKYSSYAKENENLIFTDEKTLFTQSDIISFHVPLTKETTHLVNKEHISLMKDGVIIINVSRGQIVEEKSLREALDNGKVRFAALDVISAEPMKEDNPLIGAPNIIITPHIAWLGDISRKRLIDTIALNLNAYLEGNPQNVVSV